MNEEILNSLFETPIPEPGKSVSKENESENKVIEFPGVNKDDNEGIEISPDVIFTSLLKLKENGYTDAIILVTLERLHHVTENTTLDSISEDDRELVDQIEIENTVFDMYTLDGNLVNVTYRFDTVKDAFMKDLNEILNRYKNMQEQIAESDATDTVAMITFTLVPNALDGQGVLTMRFPMAFFRVLDDNGVNATMLVQFNYNNLEFLKIDIDEDTKSEITADVMREFEVGSGGSLFEEDGDM